MDQQATLGKKALDACKKALVWCKGLTHHSPKVQASLLGFAVLLVIALALPKCAHADGIQVEVGTAVYKGYTPTVGLVAVKEDVFKDVDLQCGMRLIGQSTLNGNTQRNNGVFACSIVDELGPLIIGIGPAYVMNTDEYNGSHVNFELLLGVGGRCSLFGGRPCGVVVRHYSNAGTKDPNEGRNVAVFFVRL